MPQAVCELWNYSLLVCIQSLAHSFSRCPQLLSVCFAFTPVASTVQLIVSIHLLLTIHHILVKPDMLHPSTLLKDYLCLECSTSIPPKCMWGFLTVSPSVSELLDSTLRTTLEYSSFFYFELGISSADGRVVVPFNKTCRKTLLFSW